MKATFYTLQVLAALLMLGSIIQTIMHGLTGLIWLAGSMFLFFANRRTYKELQEE